MSRRVPRMRRTHRKRRRTIRTTRRTHSAIWTIPKLSRVQARRRSRCASASYLRSRSRRAVRRRMHRAPSRTRATSRARVCLRRPKSSCLASFPLRALQTWPPAPCAPTWGCAAAFRSASQRCRCPYVPRGRAPTQQAWPAQKARRGRVSRYCVSHATYYTGSLTLRCSSCSWPCPAKRPLMRDMAVRVTCTARGAPRRARSAAAALGVGLLPFAMGAGGPREGVSWRRTQA